MILAIVGPEAHKFTVETEQKARAAIRELLIQAAPNIVISGACPFGGIDIWARQEAQALGFPFHEYPPKVNEWILGYRPRNIQIATIADNVVCITIRTLPHTTKTSICKHCDTEHVSSGGCWTVNYARRLGKQTTIIVL